MTILLWDTLYTIHLLRHEWKLIKIDGPSLNFQFWVPSSSLEQFENFLFEQLILPTSCCQSLQGSDKNQVKCWKQRYLFTNKKQTFQLVKVRLFRFRHAAWAAPRRAQFWPSVQPKIYVSSNFIQVFWAA